MFPLSKEQRDKVRFVHRMGPYYLQAESEGMEEEFFAAVFTHHCDRWPVDISGYLDPDSRVADMERKKRARKNCNHICLLIHLDLPGSC